MGKMAIGFPIRMIGISLWFFISLKFISTELPYIHHTAHTFATDYTIHSTYNERKHKPKIYSVKPKSLFPIYSVLNTINIVRVGSMLIVLLYKNAFSSDPVFVELWMDLNLNVSDNDCVYGFSCRYHIIFGLEICVYICLKLVFSVIIFLPINVFVFALIRQNVMRNALPKYLF